MALDKKSPLSRKEKALMKVIYKEAMMTGGACLLAPADVFERMPLKLEFTAAELEPTLKVLELDDYFDVTTTDRKGDLIYCVNLHQKGLAFAREEEAFRRSVRFKVFLTVLMGVLSATVVFIVRYILSIISA